MDRYAANARYLALFAPFQAMTISAAYITPFFLDRGWSMGQILSLQAIFSLVSVVWEIPSGLVADRIGHARAIKLSAPIAAVSFIAYGCSSHYWQFLSCEILMALANGLISGADKALLYDSLAYGAGDQTELRKEYMGASRRIKSMAFGAVLPATPLAMLIAGSFGTGATLIADGLLILVGWLFVSRLVEAPHQAHATATEAETPRNLRAQFSELAQAAAGLLGNREARWLLLLSMALSLSTYLASWASAPYYAMLGIPVTFYALLLAIRSAWRALLTYHYGSEPADGQSRWTAWLRYKPFARPPEGRTMWSYVGLSGVSYLTMASGLTMLLPAVFGHDTVYALHDDHLSHRLNEAMAPKYRAMLNSVVRMMQRASFAVGGLVFGWLIDVIGLRPTLLLAGLFCSLLASAALLRLRRHGTFRR